MKRLQSKLMNKKPELLLAAVFISVGFVIAYGQTSEVAPSEKSFVPYTENYNVRFDSEGRIDYDLLISKIMPEIFEKKFQSLGIEIGRQDIVLNRGPQILIYQPSSYNCGYAIDNQENKVYWLEAAINSTHIQYANISDEIPRDDDYRPGYFDCFSPLEIQVAEIFLQEKSFFTPDEQSKVAAAIKHYLRGNDNLNSLQFKVGKFNFQYDDEKILPYCGKFEAKMAGSTFFSGFLDEEGTLEFGLEKSPSSLCAIPEDASLYDIKFKEDANPDESLQLWKNIRSETVYLKESSIEKLLKRNYLKVEYLHNMIFAYASNLKLEYVDYQPENSNTVLKFAPSKNDSYMKIRIADSGVHYYMSYGPEEWNTGKLVGVSISIDGKQTNYTKQKFIEAPEAPYPRHHTDFIFKIPANSKDVAVNLDVDYYYFDEKNSDEWRDY